MILVVLITLLIKSMVLSFNKNFDVIGKCEYYLIALGVRIYVLWQIQHDWEAQKHDSGSNDSCDS